MPFVTNDSTSARPRARLSVRPCVCALLLLLASLLVPVLAAPAAHAGASSDVEDEAHSALLAKGGFPSASECRNCHPNHYDEWSGSQHAYAMMSPIFNTMNGALLFLTNGTLGDFCIRCHTPIGMQQGEPLFVSNLERSQPSREGVTCTVCHRIRRSFGKVSGRIGLAEGMVDEPVTGPKGNEELRRVQDDPENFRLLSDGENTLEIHSDVIEFAPISTSAFCSSCHDVTSPNGLRLEEAFSEFRHSPAAKDGATCQDCHMGREPGVAAGFLEAPAAVVGGHPTRPRKRTDHRFVGADHSVIHPGLFPFSERAQGLATPAEWLTFDWKAGWGTDDFEDQVARDRVFPERWATAGDRYDAREVVDENLERLDGMAQARRKLLRRGYVLGPVEIDRRGDDLDIRVRVENGTDGHSAPTGFVAERLVWLHVVLRDAGGAVLYESGDLDPNGDLRDGHSRWVLARKLPHDDDLFTLQSRFVLRNLLEGEREEVIPVNFARDPLPFVRPDPIPNFINGGPAGARLHKKGIVPGGHRDHRYRIPSELLEGRTPPYQLSVELKAGMLPVNLIGGIMALGFDYGMSAAEVARAVVDGHQVLWSREIQVPEREPRP